MSTNRRKRSITYEIVAILFKTSDAKGLPSPLEAKIEKFFCRFLGEANASSFVTFPWEEKNAQWAVALISSESWESLKTNLHVTANLYGLEEIGSARKRIPTRKYKLALKQSPIILDKELAQVSFRLTVMGTTPENQHNIRYLAGRSIVLAIASQFH